MKSIPKVYPTDDQIIECAKRAWGQAGGKYTLERWEVRQGIAYAAIARGTPPRAKSEYVHVFLFIDHLTQGEWRWSCVGIAKNPWHKGRITWRGGTFETGHVVKTFPTASAPLVYGTSRPGPRYI